MTEVKLVFVEYLLCTLREKLWEYLHSKGIVTRLLVIPWLVAT